MKPITADDWGRLPGWVRWYVFVWVWLVVTRRKIAEGWLMLIENDFQKKV